MKHFAISGQRWTDVGTISQNLGRNPHIDISVTGFEVLNVTIVRATRMATAIQHSREAGIAVAQR